MGWLALIGTLLIPGFDPWPFQIGGCEAITACHSHEGNHLFWGSGVPSALLVLVLLIHEFWRRVCPLAFVSQLFRALGRQRTVTGRGGRREVVRAGEGVAVALVFDAGRFEELLHSSTEFSHGLLRQLAMRVETLYSTLGPASHPRQ
ncbi:MAG: hypothetical protein NTZ23_02380 [Cyanobium sp. LacPavin_0920_WC12_MAG_63_22]|nr:hypothetical protein [Cyanobium sp. LacPavin_0920_WC12_MAG_63_22]